MCGVIGIVSAASVTQRLFEGLQRMEYRGYDSAGICTIEDGTLARRRAAGKLKHLQAELHAAPLGGTVGIAHTRWATHGAPSAINAHPHATHDVAIVHNGIIENFKELKSELVCAGRTLESETDSEVVAHLLSLELENGSSPEDAVSVVLPRLRGTFALIVVFRDSPDLVVGARRGSPLVIGFGDGENFLGSDAVALAPMTERVSYLEEGDWAVVRRDGVRIRDAQGNVVARPIAKTGLTGDAAQKGEFRHYMLKEIFEQPIAVARTLRSYLRPANNRIVLPQDRVDLSTVNRISMVACGTSFYAAMIAKYWIEQQARIPVDVDVASEFRYRRPVLNSGGLALFISQSGETADTLAALRYCRDNGQKIGVVVNVLNSSMARESDFLLPIHAGPEIGVASTKAFTSQLITLAALAVQLAAARGAIDRSGERELVSHLLECPVHLSVALENSEAIARLAGVFAQAQDVLYLGRGAEFPLALEGALKLKEISYIHAEGYASGEMKHGPIALISDQVPVVVLAPSNPLFAKTVSNMEEVRARGGQVILVSDAKGIAAAGEGCAATIEMPEVHPLIAPVVYSVAIQLLAYHVAVARGTDVDQPRNLAKSVTVE